MAKMKTVAADTPDGHVAAFAGWRRGLLDHIRNAVKSAAKLEETLKWGHLVYVSNGPVLLIRAEDERVDIVALFEAPRLSSPRTWPNSNGTEPLFTRIETLITPAHPRTYI